MTTPSAGASTACASSGGMRSGFLKKKAMNRVTQSPTTTSSFPASRADTTVINAAPATNGYPSTAMGVFRLRITTPLDLDSTCKKAGLQGASATSAASQARPLKTATGG